MSVELNLRLSTAFIKYLEQEKTQPSVYKTNMTYKTNRA